MRLGSQPRVAPSSVAFLLELCIVFLFPHSRQPFRPFLMGEASQAARVRLCHNVHGGRRDTKRRRHATTALPAATQDGHRPVAHPNPRVQAPAHRRYGPSAFDTPCRDQTSADVDLNTATQDIPPGSGSAQPGAGARKERKKKTLGGCRSGETKDRRIPVALANEDGGWRPSHRCLVS